jgi:hypothetical protein
MQVWTFLRTDVSYKKQNVVSLRPELVPNIRPSTVQYVYSLLLDSNFAVRDKKEFLSESNFGAYRKKKIKKVPLYILSVVALSIIIMMLYILA